ncbi:MAG TPA: carbohydrate kinase [bacterium]|nr:carbohydrate kinase [bacterium]
MPDIISLGEALVDFVSTVSGVSVKDAPAFEKAPGGAPANVAAGLAKLGVSVGFAGKVGQDAFGLCLKETLEHWGVDTHGLILDSACRTTLAFVSLTADGQPSFAFYRNPGADMMLTPDEIDPEWIGTAKILHFGSISLLDAPARDATRTAIAQARRGGALISYDPNLRPALWSDRQSAFSFIREGMEQAEIVKMSEEELIEIQCASDTRQGMEQLMKQGKIAVFVTRGAEGCCVRCAEGFAEQPAMKVDPIDTTGAGDGFVAGVLSRVLQSLKEGSDPHRLPLDWWRETARFANTVAGLSIGSKGAIPALPTLEQVQRALGQ